MPITEGEYLLLDAAAARGSKRVRDKFLSSMRKALKNADRQKLTLAMANGDGRLAEDSVNWIEVEVDLSRMFVDDSGKLDQGVRRVVDSAGSVAGSALKQSAKIDVGEKVAEAAVSAVEHEVARRVKRINSETRLGLRAYIEEGFSSGRDMAEIEADVSALLRADGGFGLDESSATAIARRERAMREAGVPSKDRARIVKKLKLEALEARANLIARTEMQDLGNSAMLATWRATEAKIPGLVLFKVWRTRGKDACERCDALNGQRRRLNVAFDGINGDAPQRPLLNPHCYCWLDLEAQEFDSDESSTAGTTRSLQEAARRVAPVSESAARSSMSDAVRAAKARKAAREMRRLTAPRPERRKRR
jgi:hypothetical protein